MHASVVIPTKNAMPAFRQVLSRVLEQNTPWPFEIIVIDSGSRDGTVEYVREHDFVRLITIDPEEFGHGRTRNLGAEMAVGHFIAFLTHDALPADESWLANLVTGVEQYSKIAGAFGRHVAHPGSDVFVARDLEHHFEHFRIRPLIVDENLDCQKKYDEGDQEWRQFLHFFSNNNSCLRRSVWEAHRFPDVEFAEDQAWARDVIEAGYAKAYVPDAIVYHSHEYGVLERFQRSFDEARGYEKQFGYRIGSGLFGAIRGAAKLTKKDVRWVKENQINLTWSGILKQAALNFALKLGYVAGANHSKLPQSLLSRFSHDKRFLRQV